MSNSGPSLDCRMLAAARAAYYIDGTGTFTPPIGDPVYDSIQWNGTPQPVIGDPWPKENEDIDACLVGTTTDGLTVVACRGTLLLSDPPTAEEILDWVQDILLMAPYADSTVTSWGQGVMVHPGFWDAVVNITPNMNAALGTLSSNATLIFTGHSKGGAMASLAAMQYAVNNPSGPKPSVYAYAAPHPGNEDFASAFSAQKLSQTRYENNLDIVPLFPPVPTVANLMSGYVQGSGLDPIWVSVLTGLLTAVANWNYAPAGGTGWFINSSQQPQTITLVTAYEQWEALKNAIASHDYSSIAAAHCSSCPAPPGCNGGYMTGVCGTTLCGS